MAQIILNLVQGSVSFSFTPEAADRLKQEIGVLMTSLKAIAAQAASGGGKPSPQKPMEYRYTGDVFCAIRSL